MGVGGGGGRPVGLKDAARPLEMVEITPHDQAVRWFLFSLLCIISSRICLRRSTVIVINDELFACSV